MRCYAPVKTRLRIPYFLTFCCVLFLILPFLAGCDTAPQSERAVEPEIATTPEAEIAIDQNALNVLKRGLTALSELDRFHLNTQQTLEDVIDGRFRIDLEMAADLTVDRPDKIRVERYGLEMHQVLYFDGEMFTLHNPYDKVYASEALTGNIEDMFHMVRDTFGISASAADLLYPNAYMLLTQNVKGARLLGKDMIGQTTCDHLLVVLPDVSYQIWISEKEPFLPHKYVVTDLSTPHLLSYSTLMTRWDLNPKTEDTQFNFVPTGNENPIQFLRMSESVEKSTD